MRELRVNVAASVALGVDCQAGFAPEIDEAAASADPRHRFLRRAWYAGDGGECASTLVGRRVDGRVIAALPSVRLGSPKLKLRSVPGSYWPFRSFPVAADASDDELAAFLAAPAARQALGRVWRLGPVTAEDPTLLRLLRIARRSGWSALRRHAGTTFVLDVGEEKRSGPWPRPSTVRNNHKHEKRLARLGTLVWRHVRGSDLTSAVFDDLAAIERNSWVASRSGADPKFLDPERLSAWQIAVADPVIAGMLSAGVLSIGETPACFSFGIDAGNTRYCIATSYDERFAKNSPGSVTGYRTYEEAVDRGVDILNLGVGDGGQKASMGAVAGPEMVDCLFVRSRLLGLLLAPAWKGSGTRR